MGCDPVIHALGKAQAAVGAYADQTKVVPDGSRRATTAEFKAMGATEPMIKLMNAANGLAISVFIDNNTGARTVAFRGTEPSAADIATDIKNAFGLVTAQYQDAVLFARGFVDNIGGDIEFTGHSLGGGLAAAAGMATNRIATTFNAAGLDKDVIRDLGISNPNASNFVTNHYNPLDPLTIFQALTPFPNAAGKSMAIEGASLATAGHSGLSVMANFQAQFKQRGCM